MITSLTGAGVDGAGVACLGNAGQQCNLLRMLPPPLLEHVLLQLCTDRHSVSSARRTCSWLRAAFDRCNPSLSLGSKQHPYSTSSRCRPKVDHSLAAGSGLEPPQGLRQRILALIQDSPSITSLALRSHVEWASLTDILAAGSPPLAWRLLRLSLAGRSDLSDLQPLAACTALRYLDISHTTASDLRPLTALRALGTLVAAHCDALRDVAPLSQCTALTHLAIHNCRGLSQLAPLAGCTALRQLDCSSSGVHDLRWASLCPSLQHLNLGFCLCSEPARDLQPLSTLTDLRHLDLTAAFNVADLSPLAACTQLQHLVIAYCALIQDLRPLAGCTALQLLDARHTAVSDLRPITGAARSLTHLDLTRCRVTDLAPLASCSALRVLQLKSLFSLRDLAPLAACTGLLSLGLGSCRSVDDLAPLVGCRALRQLDLRDCRSRKRLWCSLHRAREQQQSVAWPGPQLPQLLQQQQQLSLRPSWPLQQQQQLSLRPSWPLQQQQQQQRALQPCSDVLGEAMGTAGTRAAAMLCGVSMPATLM